MVLLLQVGGQPTLTAKGSWKFKHFTAWKRAMKRNNDSDNNFSLRRF
jgi:hypothetical protein